jgi:hypothetical protein
MRASADQVRSASLDAVDSARGHALEVVSTGADLLATTIDKGSATIETGIDRVVDRAPAILVEVAPRRRSRWRLVLLAIVVGVVAAVVVRRLRGSGGDVPGLIDLTDPRPTGGDSAGAEVRFSVVPADGGGWDVVGAEGEAAVSHHSTQADGVDRASALAADAGGGEVVIHGRDGQPRDTRRVGPDDEAS